MIKNPKVIAEINSALKIVKLNGNTKFKTKGGYYNPTGYCLQHSEYGYFSFLEDNTDYPYVPCGGKKALKSILEGGGFLNFDNIKWLKEMD